MSTGVSLHSVDAILVLKTSDGTRLFAKYYTPPFSSATDATHTSSILARDVKAQKALEAFLSERLAKRADVEVLLHENRVVLCKVETDVAIAIVGSEDANEICT